MTQKMANCQETNISNAGYSYIDIETEAILATVTFFGEGMGLFVHNMHPRFGNFQGLPNCGFLLRQLVTVDKKQSVNCQETIIPSA